MDDGSICFTCHGKLSSASTGRFAALLLPFALVLSELNIMVSFTTGASTSISSSKSDILARVGLKFRGVCFKE